MQIRDHRKFFPACWIVLFTLFFQNSAFAYWGNAHKQFALDIEKTSNVTSDKATDVSIKDYYRHTLGLPLDNKHKYTYDDLIKVNPIPFSKKTEGAITYFDRGAVKTGEQIFIDGADDEDFPVTRTANHFFDPTRMQSLGQSVRNRKEYLTQSPRT